MNMEHFYLKASRLARNLTFNTPCYPHFMGGYNYSSGRARGMPILRSADPRVLEYTRAGSAPPCLAEAAELGVVSTRCIFS